MTGPKGPRAPTEKRPWSDVLKELSALETEGSRREPLWKRIVSDEQWAELQRLSGLPPEARNRVAQLIIIYRNWKNSPPDLPPAQTRSQLEQTAKQADHLITSIDQLYDNDTAFGVLIDRKGWDLVRLDTFSEELRHFCYLLVGARGRLGKRSKPGPANENLFGLVWSLAAILFEETGVELSLSKKRHGPAHEQNVAEFIFKVVRIADPDLKRKDHTIHNVIRKVTEHRQHNTARDA